LEKRLSVAIAHYDDLDGAYFTIQDIRKELTFNGRQDLLQQIEFVICENNPDSNHARELKNFAIQNLAPEKSLSYTIQRENKGTAVAKDSAIAAANGEFILMLDSHVLLCPTTTVFEKLFEFMDENPDTNNLYNGPLVYDNCKSVSTHFRNTWGGGMWGSWATSWKCSCDDFYYDLELSDEELIVRSTKDSKIIKECPVCGYNFSNLEEDNYYRSLSNDGHSLAVKTFDEEPFEIFGQGTGCFFVRKEAWLGYNQHARGFGGEECYIHEKFRKAGHKAYCLPFLAWMHKFHRVGTPGYPLEHYYKVRNYVLEYVELGLDLSPVHDYFVNQNDFDEIVYNSFIREAKYLYNRE
jgi:glycosyltransferase involved in cell wall biosynthesis